MTTLAHLATNQFAITRKVVISGHKKAYATTTADIKGNLQPVTGQKAELFGGKIGKTFTIFVDGTLDVEEGDRFKDTETSEYYQVVNGGVSRRTMGAIDYLQVIVELVN